MFVTECALIVQVDDRTVLFEAVKHNNIELVKVFLEFNADPNLLCRLGKRHEFRILWSAMHEASRYVSL